MAFDQFIFFDKSNTNHNVRYYLDIENFLHGREDFVFTSFR